MVGDGAASLGDLRGRVVNVKAILEVGQYLNGAWALDDQMRKHGPQQHRNILRAVDLPNADRLPSSEFSTFGDSPREVEQYCALTDDAFFVAHAVCAFDGKIPMEIDGIAWCSPDCLSRWVEAQRPIAVAEERP